MAAIEFKSSAQTRFDDANNLFVLAARRSDSAFENAQKAATTVGKDYEAQNNAYIQSLIAAQSPEDLQDPSKQQALRMDIADTAYNRGGMVDVAAANTAADNQVNMSIAQRKDIQNKEDAHKAAVLAYERALIGKNSEEIVYAQLPEDLKTKVAINEKNIQAIEQNINSSKNSDERAQEEHNDRKADAAFKKAIETRDRDLNAVYLTNETLYEDLYSPNIEGQKNGTYNPRQQKAFDLIRKNYSDYNLTPAEVQSEENRWKKEKEAEDTKKLNDIIKIGTFNSNQATAANNIVNKNATTANDTAKTQHIVNQPNSGIAAAVATAQKGAIGNTAFTTGIYDSGTVINPAQFQNQIRGQVNKVTSNNGYGPEGTIDFGKYQTANKLKGVEADQLRTINKVLAEGNLTPSERIAIWQGMVNGSFNYKSFFSTDKSSYQKQIVGFLKSHENVRGAEQTAAVKKVYEDAYRTVLNSPGSGGVQGFIKMLEVDKGGFEDFALLPLDVQNAYGKTPKEYGVDLAKFKVKKELIKHGGPANLEGFYTYLQVLTPDEQAEFVSEHPELKSTIHYWSSKAVEASNKKSAAIDAAAAQRRAKEASKTKSNNVGAGYGYTSNDYNPGAGYGYTSRGRRN